MRPPARPSPLAPRPPSLHRFFVEPAAFATPDRLVLDGQTAHQIARVLRLRPGERIVVLDGVGSEHVVTLEDVTPRRVSGAIVETRESIGEPRLEIVLYQALVPREKLETVIQKGTEVGVAAFVPVACARSLVPHGEAVDERRLERWRRIAREAAEQCRRGRVPDVCPPRRLSDAVAIATTAGPTLVAWEGERRRSVRAALREAPPAQAGRLSLFIGPEGGFEDTEIAEATGLGALTVSLGARILRTETAGPVLAALALYEAGDLEPVVAASPCVGRSAS